MKLLDILNDLNRRYEKEAYFSVSILELDRICPPENDFVKAVSAMSGLPIPARQEVVDAFAKQNYLTVEKDHMRHCLTFIRERIHWVRHEPTATTPETSAHQNKP